MKIIVSHDVDHLFWREHWVHDAFIPKHLLRSTRQWCRGELPFRLWCQRVSAPFKGGPLHNLKEVVAFDRENAVSSTCFVGVSQGLGMSYRVRDAAPVVAWLLEQGVGVGVHGIAYQDAVAITKEYTAFQILVANKTVFGVRNHYLQRNEATLSLQASAGYLFDSTEEAVRYVDRSL